MPRFRFLLVQCVTTVVVAIVVPDLALAARGYVSRACGMDLDHDGTRGEPTEDCLLCRGNATTANPAGGDWEQYYVDCATGSDTAGSGSAGSPYRSIKKGLTESVTTGNTLVVCFTGTCTSSTGEVFPLYPKKGIAGSYVIPKTGSQEYDFQYPTKPAVIMGWDTDNDGAYPPHDSNDTSIIDGEYNNRLTFSNEAGGAIEFAHFTARRFGRYGIAEVRGFMQVNQSGAYASHLFVHDLVLDGILKDMEGHSDSIVFNFFASPLEWFAFENLDAREFAGFFSRGGLTASHVRWQGITATAHGDDPKDPPPELDDGNPQFWVEGWKYWSLVDHVEFLDMRFDCKPRDWMPGGSAEGATCLVIHPSQCSQDFYIRNNEFIDFRQDVAILYDAAWCSARNIDNIVLDRNRIRNTWDLWTWGTGEPVIAQGDTSHIGNVVVTNNFISTTEPWKFFLYLPTGTSGSTVIVGNTLHGALGWWSTLPAIYLSGKNNYVLKDNIIRGLKNGNNITVADAPSNFVADGNVYDADGTFVWNSGSAANLAGWRTNLGGCPGTGNDCGSRQCNPLFLNAATGDFHLQSGDTCAKDAGVGISSTTAVDIDFDARPQGAGWDVGGDEVADGGTPLAPPRLLEVNPVP